MLFYRLRTDKMGDEPDVAYSSYLDSLIGQYTDNVFEAYMPCRVVLRQGDADFELDDEIIRYADTNVVVYAIEEKVDPDYLYIAMKFSSEEGHKQVLRMMINIESHPAFDSRVRDLRFVGVISDEPQCIPCAKRRKEREQRKLMLASELRNKEVVK